MSRLGDEQLSEVLANPDAYVPEALTAARVEARTRGMQLEPVGQHAVSEPRLEQAIGETGKKAGSFLREQVLFRLVLPAMVVLAFVSLLLSGMYSGITSPEGESLALSGSQLLGFFALIPGWCFVLSEVRSRAALLVMFGFPLFFPAYQVYSSTRGEIITHQSLRALSDLPVLMVFGVLAFAVLVLNVMLASNTSETPVANGKMKNRTKWTAMIFFVLCSGAMALFPWILGWSGVVARRVWAWWLIVVANAAGAVSGLYVLAIWLTGSIDRNWMWLVSYPGETWVAVLVYELFVAVFFVLPLIVLLSDRPSGWALRMPVGTVESANDGEI